MKDEIDKIVKYWGELPKECFLSAKKKGKNNLILIKFRDVIGTKRLFNEVEPIKGIKFIDVIGNDDYFVGEFMIINSKIYTITCANSAIILNPKKKGRRQKINLIRNDGFLNTYQTVNNSFVITTI